MRYKLQHFMLRCPWNLTIYAFVSLMVILLFFIIFALQGNDNHLLTATNKVGGTLSYIKITFTLIKMFYNLGIINNISHPLLIHLSNYYKYARSMVNIIQLPCLFTGTLFLDPPPH